MHLTFDQSGKIEATSVDTIIAFSDGISRSVLISKKEKRKLQAKFRAKGRGPVFIYKTFAILIFFLIKDYLSKVRTIAIDKEYQGKEYAIKGFLLREIRKYRDFDKNNIHFMRIGKKSRAHGKALHTFRKQEKPDIIVKCKHIEPFI